MPTDTPDIDRHCDKHPGMLLFEAIPLRMEAIVTRLEAIANRNKERKKGVLPFIFNLCHQHVHVFGTGGAPHEPERGAGGHAGLPQDPTSFRVLLSRRVFVYLQDKRPTMLTCIWSMARIYLKFI